MDFGVGFWNIRGGTQGDKATNELSDKKAAYILERISCDGLDVVWLTEVWGNRKSLKRLAERFTAIGFNYSVLQGSLSPDRSRRTGGIVALFKRSTFKYVRWIDVGSTSRLDHLGSLADLDRARRHERGLARRSASRDRQAANRCRRTAKDDCRHSGRS